MVYKRENIKEVLSNHIARVKFMKTDGTERVMECTLQESILPKVEEVSNRPVNEAVLPVWDVEKNAWRSFRIDSIMSVQVI